MNRELKQKKINRDGVNTLGYKWLVAFLCGCLFVLSFMGCEEQEQHFISLSKLYSQVLDVSYVPEKDMAEGGGFSDLGNWQSYSLPTKDKTELLGGFCGPFVHTTGRWVSKQLVGLDIIDLDRGKPLDKKRAFDIQLFYYPGLIEQSYQIGKIKVKHRLFFISDQTAFISTEINNLGLKKFRFSLEWRGNTFLSEHNMVFNEKEFLISFGDGPAHLRVAFSKEIGGKIRKNQEKSGFIMKGENTYSLLSHSTKHVHWTQSLITEKCSVEKEKELIAQAFLNPGLFLDKNRQRWDKYLQSVQPIKSGHFSMEDMERAKAKCIMTLVSNWRSPYSCLKHAGLFPSSNVGYFNGFWAWDSWKHAVALVKFEKKLAIEQLLAMFDYQNERGMVADCIYANDMENNWRNTKPPLAVWAVWEVYKKTKDTSVLANFYPKLVKYHKWWYKYRDHDQNGLCEFGSTDGTLEAAAWESGMDNAVRFDKAKMIKGKAGEWSMNHESVDLNAFLYKEKLLLAKMAKVLLNDSCRVAYLEEASFLRDKINKLMFDKEQGFYFDKEVGSNKLIKIKGPEGWLPLWANVAKKETASFVKSSIMDPKLFNTHVPFPTLNVSHELLSPTKGYWRGPVWLDQVYFGLKGLENYNYGAEAEVLKAKVFENIEGFLGSDQPLYENYDPMTGKGLNAKNFSWTAAHLLLLIAE